MEVIDYSEISDDVAKKTFEKADPCPICLGKEDLAIGVMTSGNGAGRLLLFCFRCQWSPSDGADKE